MQLASLRVQGFRGMEDLLLPLDHVTVLVGENRVGKTTLVDALDYCLRNTRPLQSCPFVPADFRRTNGEAPPPIQLTLDFLEAEQGEWSSPAFEGLEPLSWQSDAGPIRQLRLRLTGTWTANDEPPRARWEFLDHRDKAHKGAWDEQKVARLRALVPCLVLGRDRWDLPPEKGATNSHPIDPRERVVGLYRRASQTRGYLSRDEVLAGLHAARLIDASEPDAQPEPPRHLREMIETPRDLTPLPSSLSEEDSLSAPNLALLLLIGALLEARGEAELAREACPVILIEEPEAHLHPILAASLWGTLERVRAQKVITTHSGDLLAAAPLRAVRRLTRRDDVTRLHRLPRRGLSLDDLRRVGYHVRLQRGASLFARCWLLVEGETEAWLLPELARMCGYVLATEGVALLEFAQCGVRPLVRLADAFGIEWHLLADGDHAGQRYVDDATNHLGQRGANERITRLPSRDVERCMWNHGYESVFQEAAFGPRKRGRRKTGGRERPERVIRRALRKHNKPFMALRVIEAAAEEGSPGVPPALRRAVDAAVWLARSSAGISSKRPEL